MKFKSLINKLVKHEPDISTQRVTVCLGAGDMKALFKNKPDYVFECVPVTLKITRTAKQPVKAYFVVDAEAIGKKEN